MIRSLVTAPLTAVLLLTWSAAAQPAPEDAPSSGTGTSAAASEEEEAEANAVAAAGESDSLAPTQPASPPTGAPPRPAPSPANRAAQTAPDAESVATTAGRSEAPLTGRRSLESRMQRLHGMAEVGLGWLTLPGAEVCVERGVSPDCRRGDSSLALEAWQIFRLPSGFALGGGVMLGLTPTTDAPPREIPEVERRHSRGYLTVEGGVRYYPYVGESLEGWLGLSGGLVVISDTFSTVPQSGEQKPLIGPAGVVVRTEGGTFGMGGGVAYEFARNWTFGGNLRMGSWFLPLEPGVSPLGDEASLVGQVSWFLVTLNVAYRVQL